jgi:hypothetical protein
MDNRKNIIVGGKKKRKKKINLKKSGQKL